MEGIFTNVLTNFIVLGSSLLYLGSEDNFGLALFSLFSLDEDGLNMMHLCSWLVSSFAYVCGINMK